MSLTTKENVIVIAPELEDASDDLWTLVLADVVNYISSSTFGNKTEMAARYWVAHNMSILVSENGSSASGPITKYRVGDVTIEYASVKSLTRSEMNYGRTKYGQNFLAIRNACIPYFKVIVPGV